MVAMTEPATPQYVAGIGIGYAAVLAVIGAFWHFEIVPMLGAQLAFIVATVGLVVTIVRDEHIKAWLAEEGK